MWQKFENEVYYTVKKHLKKEFQVEWNHNVFGMTPALSLRRDSRDEDKQGEPSCCVHIEV